MHAHRMSTATMVGSLFVGLGLVAARVLSVIPRRSVTAEVK